MDTFSPRAVFDVFSLVVSAVPGSAHDPDEGLDHSGPGPGRPDEHSQNMKPSGGSAWSRYWYNGHVYANDIVRGVDTFLLSDSARAGARKLPYRNPQTQISVIR